MNWNALSKNSAVRSFGIVTFFLLLMLIVAGLQAGTSLVEKTVTALVMPTGIVWLLLTIHVVFCLFERRRGAALFGSLIWILYWATSTEVVTRHFSDYLEAPFEMVDPSQSEAFDYVLVLGGGVRVYEDKISVGHAGDRVVLAARLFHAGNIKHLVISGEFHDWMGEAPSIAEITETLLMQLKVPKSAIIKIRGKNTFEEFRELKLLMAEKSIESVGVITSATHMPRALRLAASNGLNVSPLPADFERSMPGPLVLDIIPSQSGLRKSTRSLKEFLARLADR